MLPVVALVGRPNVGKSTLFNVLTGTRDALVADLPGVTRDRHYGVCRRGEHPFAVIDTGGLSGEALDSMQAAAARQVRLAIAESAVVVLLTDARAGLLPQDRAILDELRRSGKPVLLAVNKTDGLDTDTALSEFAALGMARALPLATAHAHGVDALLDALRELLPSQEAAATVADDDAIRVALIGRPNVGKSTLINRLLGEERLVVSEIAGTTRDAIRVPLERDGQRYLLVDTAGVRRRARVDGGLEKLSVIKTLATIEQVQVAVLLLDAGEGITDQDLSLIGHVIGAGRALVIAANKWDGMDADARATCKRGLERRLDFVPWAEVVFISGLHGSGLRELMRAVRRAHASTTSELSASSLTRSLEQAVAAYQPPLVHGHVPKLRFAHPAGSTPPAIVIHGSRTAHIAAAYRKYLENFFRRRYKLVGTPLRLEFRDGENPYAGRKNVLTESQLRKRQRMIRHTRGHR